MKTPGDLIIVMLWVSIVAQTWMLIDVYRLRQKLKSALEKLEDPMKGVTALKIGIHTYPDFRNDLDSLKGCFNPSTGDVDPAKLCRSFLDDGMNIVRSKNIAPPPVAVMVCGEVLHILTPEIIDNMTEKAAFFMMISYAQEHKASMIVTVTQGFLSSSDTDKRPVLEEPCVVAICSTPSNQIGWYAPYLMIEKEACFGEIKEITVFSQYHTPEWKWTV